MDQVAFCRRTHSLQQHGEWEALRNLCHPAQRAPAIVLNGAAALLGKKGDKLTIMSYAGIPSTKAKNETGHRAGPGNKIVNTRGI